MVRLRNVTLLALLIVLVAVVTLAASPGDESTPITTDAFGMDAQSYASDYDVTLQEAKLRLGLQDSAGALQADLLSNESSTFGGLWVQNEPDFKIVVRFTQDGESTMRPYVTGGPLSGLVEVRTADATLNDLKTAQSDAMTLVRGYSIRVESQVDVIENRVKLFVVDRAGLDSSLAASSVQLPSKVDVVTVSQLSRNTTDLYGGLTLTSPSDAGCTSGFSVKHSDGSRGISTAAHCKNDRKFNGTDLDFVQGLLGGNHDVQWHKAPGFTLRNLVYDGSGNRYVYGTKSRANQTVGEYVCKYGIATGFDCGNIVTTSFQPTDQTGCSIPCTFSATFIRVHKNGVDLADSRDSGGPWFRGNTAYGIMRSQFGDDAIYMPINYISDLDVSVLTN